MKDKKTVNANSSRAASLVNIAIEQGDKYYNTKYFVDADIPDIIVTPTGEDRVYYFERWVKSSTGVGTRKAYRNREIYYNPIYRNKSHTPINHTSLCVFEKDTHKDVLKRFILVQDYVNYKLRKLGNSLLDDKYKSLWSEEYPTTGYCYILSEVIYHYTKGNYKVYRFTYDNGTKSHWYLKNNGSHLDLTMNQFYPIMDYRGDFGQGEEEEVSFYEGTIKTPKGKISERGYKLAQYLGFLE